MGVMRQTELIPGALYRDLDGSVVHLLHVKRGLCSFAVVADVAAPVQVTHAENFLARFRRWRELTPLSEDAREAA